MKFPNEASGILIVCPSNSSCNSHTLLHAPCHYTSMFSEAKNVVTESESRPDQLQFLSWTKFEKSSLVMCK
jgi:hypothetical protein